MPYKLCDVGRKAGWLGALSGCQRASLDLSFTCSLIIIFGVEHFKGDFFHWNQVDCGTVTVSLISLETTRQRRDHDE